MSKAPTKRGRPSAYKTEFVGHAEKLCALGATDMEIADFFRIDVATVYRWKNQHGDFCEALKVGKEVCDARVERSLYHRAIGYTFDSEKVVTVDKRVVRVPIKEHTPPDTTAMIFWLKNRKPKDWRDKQELEHTGNVRISEEAVDAKLSALLAKAGIDFAAGKETAAERPESARTLPPLSEADRIPPGGGEVS